MLKYVCMLTVMGAVMGGRGFQKHFFSLMDGYFTSTQRKETDRKRLGGHIEYQGDKIKQSIEDKTKERKRGMNQWY